jgi:hypothetical protein
MPDAETVSTLAPLFAGPGAAVLVLLAVLVGLYIIVVKHGIPLVAALGKRHLDQIDALINVQRAESAAITKTLASIDRRLAKLEDLSERIQGNSGALSPDRLT